MKGRIKEREAGELKDEKGKEEMVVVTSERVKVFMMQKGGWEGGVGFIIYMNELSEGDTKGKKNE